MAGTDARTGWRAHGYLAIKIITRFSYPCCSASRTRASSAIAANGSSSPLRDVSSLRNVPQRRRARTWNVCRSHVSFVITLSSKKVVAVAYERFKYDVLDVGSLKEVVALTRGGLRDTLRWRLHFSAQKKCGLQSHLKAKITIFYS